ALAVRAPLRQNRRGRREQAYRVTMPAIFLTFLCSLRPGATAIAFTYCVKRMRSLQGFLLASPRAAACIFWVPGELRRRLRALLLSWHSPARKPARAWATSITSFTA